MARLLLFCFFLLKIGGAWAEETGNTVTRLCSDINLWAPYTFQLDGEVVGLHATLARKAFKRNGMEVEIVARPWNRCMAGGRQGYYDGVLSASYTVERARDFYYPDDVSQKNPSRLRMTNAEYVVVVSQHSVFDWDGVETAMPQPVGVPLGYALAESLRAKDIEVTTAVRYEDLFRILARGRIKSLVAVAPVARLYLLDPEYAKTLAILDHPHRTEAYYLLFSRKGNVSAELANKIWSAVASLRENQTVFDGFSRTVVGQMEICQQDVTRCN